MKGLVKLSNYICSKRTVMKIYKNNYYNNYAANYHRSIAAAASYFTCSFNSATNSSSYLQTSPYSNFPG